MHKAKRNDLQEGERVRIIAPVDDAFERMMQPLDPREVEEEQLESEEEARRAKMPSSPPRPS